jgi:hypothetical protein
VLLPDVRIWAGIRVSSAHRWYWAG